MATLFSPEIYYKDNSAMKKNLAFFFLNKPSKGNIVNNKGCIKIKTKKKLRKLLRFSHKPQMTKPYKKHIIASFFV